MYLLILILSALTFGMFALFSRARLIFAIFCIRSFLLTLLYMPENVLSHSCAEFICHSYHVLSIFCRKNPTFGQPFGAFIRPSEFTLEYSVLLPSSRAGIRLKPIDNAPVSQPYY